MIEFKGPCGHTIRTDEGHVAEVVRCSYCGQPAVVPDQDDPNLDYLFRDVQQPDEPDRKKRRRWKRNRPKPVRGATTRGVDVFGVILRMCYAALLIIIVVLVGHHFVLPQFRDTSRKTPTDTAEPSSEAPGSNTSTATTAQPVEPRKTWLGVAGAQRSKGLFVLSVPSGAAVDCLPADDVVEGRRLRDIGGCVRAQANGVWLPLPDNTYVVEVSLPWSDPRLNDPALPHFRRYRERRIRGTGGHLSNDESAELLRTCGRKRPQWVAVAHLSEENNRPALAIGAQHHAVGTQYPVFHASRFEPSAVLDV